MELTGPWRAIVATDDLRRRGVGWDVDDTAWAPATVPGHWRMNPAFAANDEPLLYRTEFTFPAPPAGRRAWVVLDGIFYQADVWLDGAYLGDPEGYFIPHAFDVTELARLADDHVLTVEVSCSPQRNRTSKRNLTGVFQHHEFGVPDWNPGGIWRPVHLETTGPVRLDRLRVLCRDVGEERAHLRLHARLDSDQPCRIELRTTVDGRAVGQREVPVATGTNEVDWDVDVSEPALWWPWGLGDQHLVEVMVEVFVGDTSSDERTVRTGLREVGLDHWKFSINGEQLFALGVNLAPSRMDLANATPALMRHDLELAREAGLNLVRVQGHVGHPALYEAADELGMLVWQDMPLQWGYHRSVRKQAVPGRRVGQPAGASPLDRAVVRAQRAARPARHAGAGAGRGHHPPHAA
jgi:beta-mannosidase